MQHLLSLALHQDHDVVTARQRAVHIAQLLGFDSSEQTRIATAVSEIARNAFRYASGGSVVFAVEEESRPQRLVIQVIDQGSGIARLEEVLAGRYRSETGMGLGIIGARRLMDKSSIESSPSGTTVRLEKFFAPRHEVVTPGRAKQIAELVTEKRPHALIEEIQLQNQALMRALDELQRKQQELVHLNRELEDTNRGVVALYAELDEKADHLRRADELKSRFLSNMTHEFRTPVNSILGLSNLLLEDAERAGREPEPEVVYIRKAAEHLSELVNDLLDLAKVEAGKTVMRPSEFAVEKLFGALRGMLRPLLLNQSVNLVFESAEGLPPLYTDEGKVSQILRNLLSNALKFTERGEVRVSVTPPDADGSISVIVTDTGIGIAQADQTRIFEEFTQLEHRLQRSVRGTGLGLPLSRRLAELLGGTLTVESELGVGSTFTLTLPARYKAPQPEDGERFVWKQEPGRLPLLVLEDAPDTHHFYERMLRSSAFQVYPTYTSQEAEVALERIGPVAIVLDVVLAQHDAWDLLIKVRRSEKTSRTPVIVISLASHREKALALGADAYLPKPIDRRTLMDVLTALVTRSNRPTRVLVIDDEEMARYLVRQCLPVPAFEVMEATTAEQGLRRAREEHPDVVLLDLVLPDSRGEAVLGDLRAYQNTRDVPVIILTSQALSHDERTRLLESAHTVLSKAELSRNALGTAVRAAVRRGTSSDGRATTPPLSL